MGSIPLDNEGDYDKPLQEVIQDIPKMIPYVCDKTTEQYVITQNDGLMEYSDELCFLRHDYEGILLCNYGFLKNIKKIRNKLEHKMHGVHIAGCFQGSICGFIVTYQKDDEKITLAQSQFVDFMIELNNIFTKIKNEFDKYAKENNLVDHPYCCKMKQYNFQDFNKIYKSELLSTVGRAMQRI